MEVTAVLLRKAAADYNIDIDSLTKLPSTHDIYMNDLLYIKIGDSNSSEYESGLVDEIYPGKLIGMVRHADEAAVITYRMGAVVRGQDFTNINFDTWMDELDRVWTIDIKHPLRGLDLNYEAGLIHTKIDTLPREQQKLADKYIRELLSAKVLETSWKNNGFLHGDPNFRNVVFDDNNVVRLIDFDSARRGPVEWDIAVILMVCIIVGRKDLYIRAVERFGDIDHDLLTNFLSIRLSQTLVHTLLNIDLETPAGLTLRQEIIQTFLQDKTLV